MAYRSNIEFVEAKLSLDDQPKIEKYAQKYKGSLDALLPHVLNLGYTLKAGWYPDKASFAVFMQADRDNKQNNNKIMSAWSDDLTEAYFMVCYKHEVLFGGGEWNVDVSQSNWG